MAFILGFIGLLLGASLGGFWGAVILCVAGALIGKWIVRNDEASKLESLAREQQSGAAAPMREPTARSPFDDFDSLRDEVLALRRRVEHLEAVAKTCVRTESEPAPVLREFARAASVAAPELKSAPVVPPVPKPEPVPPPKVEPVAAPKPEPAPVPKLLWLNTAVLILSSGALQWAQVAARAAFGDGRGSGTRGSGARRFRAQTGGAVAERGRAAASIFFYARAVHPGPRERVAREKAIEWE